MEFLGVFDEFLDRQEGSVSQDCTWMQHAGYAKIEAACLSAIHSTIASILLETPLLASILEFFNDKDVLSLEEILSSLVDTIVEGTIALLEDSVISL